MNVLLVYPQFPDTFWSHTYALRLVGKRALLPPLGLLTVAAMLPAHWGKRLTDLNVASLTDANLDWADCVFVSAMVVQRSSARRLIARCKAAGKTVVAGGPLFASEHELFGQVDHFVLSEAEPVIAELAEDLERRCARHVYQSSDYADLRTSPTPLWELLDLSHYQTVGVQFSRGCPYNCEFCNVTAMLGRRPRTKTGEQIIAELESLHRLGWRGSVFFVDDNLIGHRPVLKLDLLPALRRWRQRRGPVSFMTQVSINLADDPALIREMVEAGFDAVFVGIETPDEDNLIECNKRQNAHRNLVENVWRLQHAGLEVWGGFIVGFDHDTPDIFQRQADFIEQSGIVTAMVGMLQAPPGTKLAERLQREGRLKGQTTGDNTDGTTNITPAMGLDALSRGYQWLLDRLYAPEPFYRRLKSFLRGYQPARPRPSLSQERLVAFARSLYHLGIANPPRLRYWNLLAWTLLHRPRLLPDAVRLAICGHHYRRICRRPGFSAPSSQPNPCQDAERTSAGWLNAPRY